MNIKLKLFLIFFISAAPLANDDYTSPKNHHLDLSNFGSCKSGSDKYDMKNVIFIQNKRVSLHNNKILKIDGDNLVIVDTKSGYKSIISIPVFIEDVHKIKNPDVEVSIVLIESNFLLFWKESYQHRIYFQGLIKIEGTNLSAVCSGKGGFDASH